MIKLKDILKEAEGQKKKTQPKPAPKAAAKTAQPQVTAPKTSQGDPEFLKQVQKGLSNIPQGKPSPQPEDPEFLKQVHKGLANADSPAAQSADRISTRFTKPKSTEPMKVGKYEPNEKIPSMSQLAKDIDAGNEEDPMFKDFPKFDKEPDDDPFDVKKNNEKDWPEDDQIHGIGKSADRIANRLTKQQPTPEDPKSDPSIPSLSQLAKDMGDEEEPEDMFKDFPKFSAGEESGSEEWDQNPFGDPKTAKEPKDTRTGIEKGVDALKKGAKTVGQGIKKHAADMFKDKEPGEVPANWQPGSQDTQPVDKPMPTMKQTTKNGLTGKHWQWKPGQQVDIGFIKDLTVQKVDQHGAVLKGKNGSTYRFIPHRGLRKISN
jgi:hypothetical protein